jgi:uncharacterized membrane protein
VIKPVQKPAEVKVETAEEKAAKKKKATEDAEKARVKELNANMLAINRFLAMVFVFSMFLMNLVLWSYLGS